MAEVSLASSCDPEFNAINCIDKFVTSLPGRADQEGEDCSKVPRAHAIL